jgi:uncharacterized protein (TIGR02117 family)
MIIKKIFKYVLIFISAVILFVVFYFISAYSLSRISVNNDYECMNNESIEIYLLTNGAHTDLVLPLKNEHKDWSQLLPYSHLPSNDSTLNYAAFGWGDKGFYLDTPTWADLKASTAFKASFWLSSSAMHVTFYKNPEVSATCRKILVDKAAYQKLTTFIESSFRKNEDGSVQHIVGHSYAQNDAFYDAKRTYNLFYTCNTWTNEALKQSGLKACIWTPFQSGLMKLY